MRTAEKNRLLRKSREELVAIIDETQKTVRRWKEGVEADIVHMKADMKADNPPFYWGIAFIGWGSFEDNVDFIDGGEGCPTAQAAVDAWEDLRQQQLAKASDQDSLDPNAATLLVYRIDEIGRATTDRRWVFKAKGE